MRIDPARSLRGELEELSVNQIQHLANEALAEARRRNVRVRDSLEAAADELRYSLTIRGDRQRTLIERENDYQEAERMATLWAERADSLAKERAVGAPSLSLRDVLLYLTQALDRWYGERNSRRNPYTTYDTRGMDNPPYVQEALIRAKALLEGSGPPVRSADVKNPRDFKPEGI